MVKILHLFVLIILIILNMFLIHLNTFKYILASLSLYLLKENSSTLFVNILWYVWKIGKEHAIRISSILSKNIQNKRKKVQYHFSKTKTFPRKWEFYEFKPLSKDCIGEKWISYDEQYPSIYNFIDEQISPVVSMPDITLQSYVDFTLWAMFI